MLIDPDPLLTETKYRRGGGSIGDLGSIAQGNAAPVIDSSDAPTIG